MIRDLACLAGGFPARLTRSNPRGLGWIMALGQKMGCALQASMGLRAASQGRALQASMGLRAARPSVLSRGLRSWQPHTEARSACARQGWATSGVMAATEACCDAAVPAVWQSVPLPTPPTHPALI